MNSLDLNTFLLALYFITPGIVTIKARDLTVASPERNWGEKTFALLSFSAFNLLLYQLLVPAINALYSLFHWPPVLDVSVLVTSKSINFGSIIRHYSEIRLVPAAPSWGDPASPANRVGFPFCKSV